MYKSNRELEKLIELIYTKRTELIPFLNVLRRDIEVLEFKNLGSERTADITLENKKFRITINKIFVKAFNLSEEDVLWLLCHELSHFVLGHLSTGFVNLRSKEYCNILFDTQVNSMLYNINNRQRIPLFDRYYSPDYNAFLVNNPECQYHFLLMPPPDEIAGLTADFKKLSYPGEKLNKIRDFWYANYSETGLSLSEIDEALAEILPNSTPEQQEDITQLMPEELPDTIIELQREFDEFINSGGDESFYQDAQTAEFHYRKAGVKNRDKAILKKAILSALYPGDSNSLTCLSDIVLQTVLPTLQRREMAMLSSGIMPLMYSRRLPDAPEENAAIYIDFSISTREYQNDICNLLFSLRSVHKGNYYIFSNELKEVTYKELREGKVDSAGTDINPVIEHIINSKVTRALVITDGEFAPAERFTNAEIFVLLFERYNSSVALEKSARVKKVWYLKEK